MTTVDRLRFVIDTNVVFEGLTKQGSASGLLIDSWLANLFQPFATNALAYEYADVLTRKLSPHRLQKIFPVLQNLLAATDFVPVYYTWRPIANDSGDDHIVDCAMNTNASVVTWNLRDFRTAQAQLGLSLLTPVQAVQRLAER